MRAAEALAGWIAFASLLLAAGCGPRPQEPAAAGPTPTGSAPRATSRAPVELRILFTSDEHGWVAPVAEAGKPGRDGAPVLLTLWREREGHCVPSPADRCEASGTLALSGGDNWTGPAMSSFFQGEVAAETMKRLGYAASAFGNHELDFGRKAFDKNRAIQGFPYLAANVIPPLEGGGVAIPFAVFQRRGVKVGVIGLATKTTPLAGMRANYDGLTFGDEEEALTRAVPATYAAGADVVVVIGHVCGEELAPIVEKHPDWALAFVGGGHCHKLSRRVAAGVNVVEAGSFLRHYLRATLAVDLERPAKQKLASARVDEIDLSHAEGAPPLAAPDPELAALVETWRKKTDEALGEVLGFAGEPLEPDSAGLANFITDRWREATGADVAILNRFGTRQAINRGTIKLETIHSVLPFTNRLVTVKVTGKELIEDVTCCGGHVSGVRIDEEGRVVLEGGAAIDPQKRYTVVSTDYAYYGGSGFPLEKQDPKGVFGEDWREPLVRFLRKNPTREGKGLETLVDRTPRVKEKKKRERHEKKK